MCVYIYKSIFLCVLCSRVFSLLYKTNSFLVFLMANLLAFCTLETVSCYPLLLLSIDSICEESCCYKNLPPLSSMVSYNHLALQ